MLNNHQDARHNKEATYFVATLNRSKVLPLESRLQTIFTAPLGEKLLAPLIATSKHFEGLEGTD